jgi:nucleoside-diphosphate-sugar epimerase
VTAYLVTDGAGFIGSHVTRRLGPVPLPVVAGVLLTVVSMIAAVAVLVWDVAAGTRRFTARRGAERR